MQAAAIYFITVSHYSLPIQELQAGVVCGTGEGKQLGNESLGEQDELIPFPHCFLFSDNKDKQIDHFWAGSNGLLIAGYFL